MKPSLDIRRFSRSLSRISSCATAIKAKYSKLSGPPTTERRLTSWLLWAAAYGRRAGRPPPQLRAHPHRAQEQGLQPRPRREVRWPRRRGGGGGGGGRRRCRRRAAAAGPGQLQAAGRRAHACVQERGRPTPSVGLRVVVGDRTEGSPKARAKG